MSFIKFPVLFSLFCVHNVFAQNFSWSAGWTSLALRPLPVYYDHQNWRDFKLQHQMKLAYHFSKSKKGFQKIQVQTAYSHPLKQVPDPDIFGFQDMEVVLFYAFHSSLQVFVSGLLPLSKSSVKKPLTAAGSVGFSYFFPFPTEQEALLSLNFRQFLSLNTHHNLLKSFLESYIYNDLLSLNHELNITGPLYAGFVLESSWVCKIFILIPIRFIMRGVRRFACFTPGKTFN